MLVWLLKHAEIQWVSNRDCIAAQLPVIPYDMYAPGESRCPVLNNIIPAGFLKDEYTRLEDTTERIVATSVTSTWSYVHPLPDYHAPYQAIKQALAAAFFGPPHEGVYSPSVQFTLFQMGEAAVRAVSAVESIYLNMPNIHFLPCNPVHSEPFADDVYVATSEPHGTIEATVTRKDSQPHSKL